MMDSIEFLQRMVAIPSLSSEEGNVAEFIVASMQRLNYDSAWVDEAGNAIGVREHLDEMGEITCEVVLLGHMDTVPGDIPVRIEDGILHGRGSVDAKGPLATFVMAVAEAELPAGMRAIVIGAVEEESATSKGARHIVGKYRPNFCIIGEPSGWDGVTLGYKGRLLIDLKLEREMGHTAGQQSGVAESAIVWWNKVSAHIEEYNSDKPRLFDQLIPSIRNFHTASDGLIDSADLRIGIRLPEDFDCDAYQEMVNEWADDAELTFHSHEPAYKSTRKTELARAFNIALRQAGVRPRFKVKTGTSDMNIVGPIWNCPIVAYGPGDSQLDHTPHEHVVLDEYMQAIEILKAALLHLK